MSFVTQDDVFAALEPVLAGMFEEFADGKSVTPARQFPRIPYAEAMLKYGTDKPDLRNPIVITDVSEHFKGSGFGLFAQIVGAGGVVRAIPAPGTAEKSRKFFDDMNEWARKEGFAGLGYVTQQGRRVRRADRQEPWPRRHERKLADGSSASAPTTACSSPPARKRRRPSSPAPRARASASSSA